MKQGFWKRVWQRPEGKRFSAWQIELTSRCLLQCRMCNKIEYNDFSRKDMSLENFQKLIPYFKDIEAIVLEGWGESLLHQNLIEIIQLVKKEGPRVGFVTSGMGLNEAYLADLLRAGVDFMGFSLSGTTPKTHNSIRVNSDLNDLLDKIRLLQDMKTREKLPGPRIHLVYLLLKDNIQEVPDLIPLARELNIEEVVLINLIHVTNAWQEEQRVFGEKTAADFAALLQEADKRAREGKIKLRCPSLSFQEVAVCAEDPLHNLYVAVEGDVSPCVYLNPPLPSPFKRIFHGKETLMEKVQFGNLFHRPLEEIWNDQSNLAFRKSFALREKKYEEMAASLWNRDKFKPGEMASLPDPPEPCRTCYKILGV